ncbi:hypothetical protein Tco_0370619 [Tanacetum coccineum]
MNIGEALLRGVPERLNKLDPDSNTDIMVSDVNAPNIPNHDVVAELFDASLKSYKDVDDFTKGIKLAGLEAVLEGGPWLILFKEDGISLIATFIDKLVMLDSYTSSMCKDSWGRSSFAPCLIEVNLEADLVDVVTIGIPSLTGDWFTKETTRVEYEWKPPRCDICKIFGHVHDHYRIKVVSLPIVTTSTVVAPTVVKSNDGFQMVGKKRRGKLNPSLLMVVSLLVLRLNKVLDMSQRRLQAHLRREQLINISTSNSFSALNDDEEDEDEDVEIVHDESANLFSNTKTDGSSYFIATAGSGDFSVASVRKYIDDHQIVEFSSYEEWLDKLLNLKMHSNRRVILEGSKDLTSLSHDELIENLKVHEMIIKKDSEIVKAKVERKSLALQAKKESSDEE